MGIILEQILTYGAVLILCAVTVYVYMKRVNAASKKTELKVAKAKEDGLFEPVSLYPHIDLNSCIGSAACIEDCPEKDILGIVDGKATVINTTNCIGHGACFHSCPVEAITLRIGTETRGVDLPHVNQNFESNMRGIYIAGELGGMGLIKNSVEQGEQAIEYIMKSNKEKVPGILDVIIIGAGPAGISATLAAKKHSLKSLTLEQDSLGGTVFTYPRDKVVMTAPMNLPLHGKVKLYETRKAELLNLWKEVIREHDLTIHEKTKVEHIIPQADGSFKIVVDLGTEYLCNNVLLAIGRRGSPRKLEIPGEDTEKVSYRLMEPERISGKKIMVVGGGDSAIEAALQLKDHNEVHLSYRKEKFARCKPKNREKIAAAEKEGSVKIIYNSNLVSINREDVLLTHNGEEEVQSIANDLVYVLIGGELPTKFLQKAGVEIARRFGYIMKKHK